MTTEYCREQKQKPAKSALKVIEIAVNQGHVKTARTKPMTNISCTTASDISAPRTS